MRTVIVEDASRFARELMTQELGLVMLIARGVKVFTASGDELTDDSAPGRTMMRQIAGTFHQYEKARLVAKLRAARERKRATGVKVDGRKSWVEMNPAVVEEAQRLQHVTKSNKLSLRKIVAELAKQGHLSNAGTPLSPSIIKSMLGTRLPALP